MSQLVEQDDEIDLGELFAAIWYSWWIVGLATFVSVFLAGFYAFVAATSEYKASTRFELLEGDDSGPVLGQAAGFAAFAGLSIPGSASEADAIEDRVLSRPFVDSIYENAGFAADPIFNATLREPGLVSKVIEFVFGPAVEEELARDDYLVIAIGELRERMVISPGENGIIELTLAHPDGERAAQVANVIIEQTLLDIFERERNESREGLNYFAEELLQVRADLDAANAAVRDYAITNNLQSAEELARTSAQLAQVRRDIEVIDESIKALEAMKEAGFSGPKFAQTHPVSTSLSFRRLLGLSGDPNIWAQPSEDAIAAATERLTSQESPLISTFNALEERAKSSGAEALRLAALEREVEVQQAIYESVITQFEARSLVSGFERASGRIVETAIAPSKPSSPNKPLVVALGLVLGIFVGIAIALIASMRRGKLYTYSAIRDTFALAAGSRLMPSRLAHLSAQSLSPKQLVAAQDLLVALEENNKILPVATPTSEQLSARLVLGLSKAASLMGESAAILDVSQGAFEKLSAQGSEADEKGFRKRRLLDNIDILEASDLNSFLKPSTCAEQLAVLKSDYDRIFVVLPVPEKGTAIARNVAQSMDNMIIVARRGKTTRAAVDAIKAIYSSKVSDPCLVII